MRRARRNDAAPRCGPSAIALDAHLQRTCCAVASPRGQSRSRRRRRNAARAPSAKAVERTQTSKEAPRQERRAPRRPARIDGEAFEAGAPVCTSAFRRAFAAASPRREPFKRRLGGRRRGAPRNATPRCLFCFGARPRTRSSSELQHAVSWPSWTLPADRRVGAFWVRKSSLPLASGVVGGVDGQLLERGEVGERRRARLHAMNFSAPAVPARRHCPFLAAPPRRAAQTP
mmetsp:Transcript_24851/g.83493  ORF Transcript_24851/g.83493 Transcript_24851/m.83493 type:complete len:230 (+) Transcript_24851:250-939(+)